MIPVNRLIGHRFMHNTQESENRFDHISLIFCQIILKSDLSNKFEHLTKILVHFRFMFCLELY